MCRDELLTLRYDPNPHKPMRLRFSEQPGVTVKIADYGRTASAPVYEPMYEALEAAGYTRDRDIRVAGYDAGSRRTWAASSSDEAPHRGRPIARTAAGRSTSSATRTGRSTSSTC